MWSQSEKPVMVVAGYSLARFLAQDSMTAAQLEGFNL